jgi:hypothetical protein
MKASGMMTLWVLILTGVGPRLASAQTVGLGYAFSAPVWFGSFPNCCGLSTVMLHAGGGGEALIGNWLGVGADVGYIAPLQYFSEGFGLLSVNGSYHFLGTGVDHRTQPFVTSGYSLAFRNGHASLWNLGGGADYWITPTVGMRIEVRDHIFSEHGARWHLWGPRLGVVIRSR